MAVGFTLSDFKNSVADYARPNRFIIRFAGSDDQFFQNSDVLTYMASKISIPHKSIQGPQIRYRGTTGSLAGDMKLDPLTIQFLNDSTWKARGFFESWMESIVSGQGNDVNNENARPSSDQVIFNGNFCAAFQMGRNPGVALAAYFFYNMVPIDISDIDLDRVNENMIEEFTVTFNFTHYVPRYYGDSPNNLATGINVLPTPDTGLQPFRFWE